jgi:predicted transcriptional regulator of viral defense system
MTYLTKLVIISYNRHMEDLKLIERILIGKGRIVKHSDLSQYLAEYRDINKKISTLVDKGLLVNLQRGTYYISKLGSLGYTSISNYIIANTIGEESFVSFEAALSFHGVFDQGLQKYRSISKKQYLDKTIEDVTYEYVKVKDSSYFGYEVEGVDGGQARIATLERALLDLIEYKRSISTQSLVLEKLSRYQNDIDFKLVAKYLKNYSQITIKICGFFFDLVGKDSKTVESLVNKDSTSRTSASSVKFSNKWRLYYDPVLEEQLK